MKTNIFQGLNLNRENYFANLLKNIGGVIDDGIRVNIILFRIRSEYEAEVEAKVEFPIIMEAIKRKIVIR